MYLGFFSSFTVFYTMFSMNHVFGQMEPETDYLSAEREQWLKKFILVPFQHHCFYVRGILFSGPSGSGKTMCVHAFAKRLNMPVLAVACQETVKEYSSTVSARLQSLFIQASESGSLFHLDGVEALVGKKCSHSISLVNTFKAFMQQYSDVIVVGTTDNLNAIDTSVRCVGQFSHELYFDYLNTEERLDFLKYLCRMHPLVDVQLLAEKTEKYTMAQLNHVVNMALINKLSDGEAELRDYHFDVSVFKIDQCNIFEKWNKAVNICLIGKNTYKTIEYLMHHLYSVFQVTEFPVVQHHYKYYIIKHVTIYNVCDVVDFLEWCILNQKIVIASSLTRNVNESITSFFGMHSLVK